jgi:hypothetical protein
LAADFTLTGELSSFFPLTGELSSFLAELYPSAFARSERIYDALFNLSVNN